MSSKVYRSGAVRVYLPFDKPTIALGDLTTLTFTASAVAWTTANNNDRRSNLDTTATYQVVLTLVGHDATNQGLSITGGSPGSGLVTVTSTQGISVSVAPNAWPANTAYASGVAVWIDKNQSGQFKLHSIIPPDTSNTWATMIICEPGVDAISETFGFLVDPAQVDSVFPNRTSLKGVDFTLVGDTQDGVTLEDTTEQINYKPDLSTNYALAITRGLKITFSVLNDNLSDFIQARAGEYVKFNNGSNTYEVGLRNYQAASAVNTGNRPIKILFPIDSHKAVEVLYAYASIKENQSGGSTKWGKTDPPVLDYTIETINQDTMLQGVFSTSSRIIYAT